MSEERLKEIRSKINYLAGLDYDVKDEVELYNEVISLQKRNKEIYEGFLATQEEMSDYAEENEKLKSRIEKAVEYIEWSNYVMVNNNDKFFNYLDKLLNILRGKDND